MSAQWVLSERTRWMQIEAVLFALTTFKGYSDVLVCSNIKRDLPILKFSSNAFHGIKVTQVFKLGGIIRYFPVLVGGVIASRDTF